MAIRQKRVIFVTPFAKEQEMQQPVPTPAISLIPASAPKATSNAATLSQKKEKKPRDAREPCTLESALRKVLQAKAYRVYDLEFTAQSFSYGDLMAYEDRYFEKLEQDGFVEQNGGDYNSFVALIIALAGVGGTLDHYHSMVVNDGANHVVLLDPRFSFVVRSATGTVLHVNPSDRIRVVVGGL